MRLLRCVSLLVLWSVCGLSPVFAQQELDWDLGLSQVGSAVFSTNAPIGQYMFRITTTNSAQSVGCWRTQLRVTSGEANLYLRRGSAPTTSTYDLKSDQAGSDGIVQALTAGQEWHVLVDVTTAGEWSLVVGDVYVGPLSWDSGLSEIGTGASESASPGEDRYFKIVTENADLGMWRTVLKATVGDAGLYMKKDGLPIVSGTTAVFDHQSNLAGDDGWVLPLSNTAGAGQIWYVLVKPQAGASWNLFSGDIYVEDLGALAADGSSGSGGKQIPAEGIRYFKTTIPSGTQAWRLWVQDATGTNTLNQSVLVRKGLAPNGSEYDRLSSGQMLVVPSLLEAGGTSPYYVGIAGERGASFQLDSRKHGSETLTYGASVSGSVTGFRFKTYRVDVPPDQIAWELMLTPLADSNPDMAIHYAQIPNATDNMAFSELVSSNRSESITLVPPQLSSGSYYITLYSATNYSYTLANRQPVITQTDYIGEVINDDVNRAGWRYYAVTDIDQQLGSLGWLLRLSNQVAGTQLAIRRNNVPGQWSYREGGSTAVKTRSFSDKSSVFGALQDPDHAADVWYIGVYMPSAALGNFRLSLTSIEPTDLNVENDSVSEPLLYPGSWIFYQVDVSATASGGQPVLGWELRLNEWAGVSPKMIVRRGALPSSAKTSGKFGTGSSPHTGTGWDIGSTWAAPGGEWTGYSLDSTATITNPQTILSMAMGRPLVPGRYYIGLYNDSADQASSFSLTSRAIGAGLAHDIGVLPIDGEMTITNLPAGNVAYYRVDLPENTYRNWKFKLQADDGESLLYIRRGYVPTWGQDGRGFHSPGEKNTEEIGKVTRLQKAGDEHFVLFPENTLDDKPKGETYSPYIPGGTYYCMVVSEGQAPTSSAIGSGGSTATLQSLGEIEPQFLGILNEEPLTYRGSFEAGAIDYLNFTWGGGVGWYRLNVSSSNSSAFAQSLYALVVANDKGGGNRYGGMYSGYSEYDPPCSRPSSPYINIIVSDPSSKESTAAAEYDITVSRYEHTDIAFDGADVTVTGLCGSVVYRVEVPDNCEGWELRLTEWTGSRPSMTVCYESYPDPDNLGRTEDIKPATDTNWPAFSQWAVSSGDWTQLAYDAGNEQQHPQYVMSMGMGRPLSAGTYYIVFHNPSCATPATFSFVSRGIGAGYTYDPTPIAFGGGEGVISNLAARDVQYFEVDVPSDAASWAVKLENTVGESSLYIRKDFVPTIGQKTAGFHSPGEDIGSVTHLQKLGDEYFVLLPEEGDTIPAGKYYLMVVGLGEEPTSTVAGNGLSSAVLRSLGEATIVNLGYLPETGEIVYSNHYAAGEAVLCQFTVPAGVLGMEMRMLETTGYSMMHLEPGTWFPPVNAAVRTRYAGLYSGNSSKTQQSHAELITVAQPVSGVWSALIVDPRAPANLEDAAFAISILTLSTEPCAFEGGSMTSTNLAPNNWSFFSVEVPFALESGEAFLGWELRMKEWSGEKPPHIVVRRNALPDGLRTMMDTGSSWRPANAVLWPAKYQWATSGAPHDWSFYRYSSGRTASYPEYILSMANGRPLEPGRYLVGIFNPSLTTPARFTCESRVIGGADYPVQSLAFQGGEGVITDLPVRGLAYFKVTVPEGAASWNVHLDNVSGESMLYIRKDYVPTWEQATSSIFAPDESTDKMVRLKKTGDEHYTLMPKAGETSIPAGDYYLMVVSEGINPTTSDAGSGASSAVLKSLGANGIADLGSLTVDNTLVSSVQYEAGDVRLLQFDFAPEAAISAFEIRVSNRVGMPNMNLLAGAAFSNNDGDISSYYGGLYSPHKAAFFGRDLITVANATNGIWSLVVSDPNTAANLRNGSCTLTFREKEIPVLNGDEGLNTNGMSHAVSGALVDTQRAFYEVVVPETLNGKPVLGWYLKSGTTQGALHIRAREGALPQDGNRTQTGWGDGALMVVPPFLTPGTWYVEVTGIGSTSYSLTSSFIVEAMRTWNMPAQGESITTPGLSVPFIGDTGVDTNGIALAGDQGVDLVRGHYDIYAVDIPATNAGLLSTRLEAISGNPDLYIRYGDIPTINHDMDDRGYFYDRLLDDEEFTQYGNWVPLDGRNELELAAGRWFLMVKAEGSSDARYRLRLAGGNVYPFGNVQELALDAGTIAYAEQTLAKGDWRYYRVEMPDPVPYEWVLHFAATQGDVDLFIRDTVPPGNGKVYRELHTALIDWRSDDKMAGTEAYYPNEGSHAIRYDLLKGGRTYYVGVLAKVDATFRIGSTTNAGPVPVAIPLDFYSGFVSNQIPARSSVTYRIDVPEDAVRWFHSNTNSSSVQLYLKQGGWPSTASSGYDYRRTAGSGNLNQFLFNQSWPWLTGEPYFLMVTNTSTSAQSFELYMAGSNAIEVPASLTASDGLHLDRVSLSWSSIRGASRYSVYRSLENDPSTAVLMADAVTSTSFNDFSSVRGVTNYYWASVYGAPDSSWFSVSDGGWVSGIAEVSPSQFSLPFSLSSISVDVTAADGLLWSANESLSWVTINGLSQFSGSGTAQFNVMVNNGGPSRTGTVYVAGCEVTIIQEGFGEPQHVQATEGTYSDRIVVTWDMMPSEAYRYYLRRATVDDLGQATDIGFVETNQFIDSGLEPDRNYYYWVRARLFTGYGDWSKSAQGSLRSSEMTSWIDHYFSGMDYPGDEADSDGDGYSNLEEYIAGSNPVDAESYFVPFFRGIVDGYIIFDIPDSMNRRLYDIQWTDSLQEQWVDMMLNEQGYGGALEIRAPKGNGERRFFRPTVRME
jgi:large repetitive protein